MWFLWFWLRMLYKLCHCDLRSVVIGLKCWINPMLLYSINMVKIMTWGNAWASDIIQMFIMFIFVCHFYQVWKLQFFLLTVILNTGYRVRSWIQIWLKYWLFVSLIGWDRIVTQIQSSLGLHLKQLLYHI